MITMLGKHPPGPALRELKERAEERARLLGQDSVTWRLLGAARYRTGDVEGAIEALERSRELARADGVEQGFLALARNAAGDAEGAREAYGRFSQAVRRSTRVDEYPSLRLLQEVEQGRCLTREPCHPPDDGGVNPQRPPTSTAPELTLLCFPENFCRTASSSTA